MCSQRVSVTAELREHRVECPRCHHRESGGVFIDSETPVAVLLAGAGRPEPATIALSRSGPAAAGFARHGASDEERTHLLLDAESLLDEEPRPRPEPPPARASGRQMRAPPDERTHLLLDAESLLDEEPAQGPGPAARERQPTPRAAPRWLALGRLIDGAMHGRWRVALAVLALACGVLPPLLDGLGADGSAPVSRVASFTWFVAVAAYGLAALAPLRMQRGWESALVVRRAQAACALLRGDLAELRHSPRYLRLLIAGQLAALAGASGVTLASTVSLLRAPFGSYDPPSVFRLVSGLLALAGAVLMLAADRAAPAAAPGPDDFAESLAAAHQLPPIVDLQEPLPASFIGGYTTFHKVLVVMSQWRGAAGPDEGSCRAALERHLQRHLSGSRIESDKWWGARRSDGVAQLLVDGMILIEVRRGFAGADAEEAIARMQSHARRWADKPMILCVFDAPRASLFESAATAPLIALHESSPLVTARMPARG